MPLQLEIITPDARVHSGEADQVILPTEMGETGILPGHVPLVTKLVAGELRAMHKGKTEAIAVDVGFAKVLGNTVSVLTEAAVDVDEIDLSEVESARARAEAALEEARASGEDPTLIEKYESDLRFAIAQKLAKGRRR
jgi:F-type H+-transporting ATPase subunit epsilon